jgi:hypothetical protein
MNQGKAVEIKCLFRAAWIFILKVSGQESTRDCLAAVGRTNLQKSGANQAAVRLANPLLSNFKFENNFRIYI